MKARRTFRRRLLAWYATHRRDLPWRKTRDPYRILVAEVMLQQTQVDRVIPKYHEFLRKYPTLETLARAPRRKVTETWYPLGYNVRPVHLQMVARETVARYGGKLPEDPETLRTFKGIGPYTAGAIASFAYGKPEPILDTNIRRVLGRVFYGTDGRRLRERELWDLAGTLVPQRRAYDFNQALMDFGATWCTPRKPLCAPCPLRQSCRAYPLT